MAEQYCSRDGDKWGEVDKVKDARVEDVIEIEVGNRCSENAIVNKFVGESCIEENGPMLYNIDCWHLNDQGDELVEDFSHLESLFQHNKENCVKEIKVATGLGTTSKEVVYMSCTKGISFFAAGQINNGGMLSATKRSGDGEETPKELRRNYLVGVYHVLHDWDRGPLFVNMSELPSFLISASCVAYYKMFLSIRLDIDIAEQVFFRGAPPSLSLSHGFGSRFGSLKPFLVPSFPLHHR
ncbi:hypothetical protein TIFTF001_010759 [Ficus carica]|uniref:Uncharacterized protein n=1 Tax=Ficus carica TaxID=3494 RepID=A0AA88ACT0_FICCA|nr:hypothetical protein TIFTF001_010759 [Ficus carica]